MRRPVWWWTLIAAAWCALIFASSSTVIFPHQFFAWMAAHVLPNPGAYHRFVVFWGVSWFAIVKGWHAVEYALLATIAQALIDRLDPSRPRRNATLALGFTLAFAASDEYHQTFVPGRGGTWSDVMIDALGATLAVLGYQWLTQRRRD